MKSDLIYICFIMTIVSLLSEAVLFQLHLTCTFILLIKLKSAIFVVKSLIKSTDFMDFSINPQIYLKSSNYLLKFHHPSQVFIVDFLVSLINPVINNIYSLLDLFVVCLDFHFSNPMSDPRMVLRRSRLWGTFVGFYL